VSAHLRGLIPILATPFHSDGSLDRVGLRRITQFQLDAGVDGVAVFGMASEGFALTAEERRIILADVTDVVAGAVPIVAGVNATSTVTAIEQTHAAAEGGADVVMVIPPYMVKPAPATIPAFYADVAAATSLEVMVQDAPVMTGVAMSVALIAELADIPGVTSVKVEAPPTLPKIAQVSDVVGGRDDFVVLGGQNAQFCLDEYERGSVGTMPACEFSDALGEVLGAWGAGDRTAARAGFGRLLPLVLFGLQSGIAWAVHKEVLVARGLIEHPFVRYPGSQLDTHSRATLAAILDELALPALTGASR
jgi:4-hydroxy-tetrahydrodipicolinate synthase